MMKTQRNPIWCNVCPTPHATRSEPPLYKPNARLMIMFRSMKLSSPPRRSLYIHVSPNSSEVSCHAPKEKLMARTTGSAVSNSRRIWAGVTWPAGIGRHGLLRVSSVTDSGDRWLAMSKMRRFNQFQASTDGKRIRMAEKLMAWLVVKTGPARAPKMPNAVSGITKVQKSLSVSSQNVWSACVMLGKTDCFSRHRQHNF